MELSNTRKKCPLCGEMIQADAIKCRFCGEFIDKSAVGSNPGSSFQNPMYDDRTDDKLLIETHPSYAAIAGSFIVAIVVLTVAAFVAFGIAEPYTGWIGFSLAVIVLLWLGIKIMAIRCTNYRISADRIEYERGIFSRSTDNLDMFRVTDLKMHRTLLDRLFNIGTVEILSSDETHPVFFLVSIPNPREAYDLLKQISLSADRRRGVIHYEH